MKVLFVFLVLEHRRRQVLHFHVTEHPSAAWTSQQIVEAFANQNPPRYLLRDRDRIYGNEIRFADRITADGRSAHRAPESLAESIRRTADRLDPQGLSGSFRDPQREASQANFEFLFRLLPQIEDSFRTRQAMSTCTAGLECRKDRQDSAPRRPASPL